MFWGVWSVAPIFASQDLTTGNFYQDLLTALRN